MSALRLRIGVNEIVGVQGRNRRYVITQILPGSKVGVRECGGSSTPEPVPLEWLTEPPLAPDDPDTTAQAAALQEAQLDREYSEVSAKDWEEAHRRMEIVRTLVGVRRPPVKERAREVGCHWTTLYEWMCRYRNSGQALTSLLPGKPSVPKGTKRLHPAVEKLLDSVITKHFLTPQRLRVTAIDNIMQIECHAQGIPLQASDDGSSYHKPHINTIRARIDVLSARKKLSRREGRDKASKVNSSGEGFHADYPLEYVQIDHTKVNVILRDEATGYVMGRPHLTVAIDVYSRMVVGYYIAFEAPGALATGICISQAILAKEDWLRERAEYFHQVPHWPCYGCPVNLHMDNAKEFRGDMVKRACDQYNINVFFRPVRTPQMGAHIESLMDKLSDEFRTLPGATFANPVERGKNYDSEKEAAVSFKEFDVWLANHLLVLYHNRVHSGLDGQTPIQRWEQGMTQGTNGTPARGFLPDRFIGEAAERLRLDFLPLEKRKISERGVSIDRVQYMDPVLRRWINAKDPGNHRRHRDFIFRRDPRDIKVIYFWNPDLLKYEPISYRDAWLPAVSLWELRAARRYLHEKESLPGEQHTQALIFGAVRKKREIEEGAARRRKKIKAAGQYRPGTHKQNVKPATHDKPKSDVDTGSASVERRRVKPFKDLE